MKETGHANTLRRRVGIGVAAVSSIGMIAIASPAMASENDGVIQDGEFVAWSECGFTGPFYDFAGSAQPNYNGLVFRGPATGDPSPSDPAPSDPAPSDPTPSDPAPSNPAPGNPSPSDPAPGEPSPSVDPTTSASASWSGAIDTSAPMPVNDNIRSVKNFSTVNSINAYIFDNYSGPRLVVLPGRGFDLCSTNTPFAQRLRSHNF